jgi:hypothetical protein
LGGYRRQVYNAWGTGKNTGVKSYWKLNASILKDEDFEENFKIMFEKAMGYRGHYLTVLEWWDKLLKPEIKLFCIRYSAMLSKGRKQTKFFLYKCLTEYQIKGMWKEVAAVRRKIKLMLREEVNAFVVRSKMNELAEEELGSLHHFLTQMI